MDLHFKDHKIYSFGNDSYGFVSNRAACLLTHLIQSERDVVQFYSTVKQLDPERRPLRMSSLQLSSPFTEWDTASGQRLWLTWLSSQEGSSAQAAHYLLPTEPLFQAKERERPSEFFLKDLQKLIKYFNIAALELYCYWFAEEIEKILEKFALESADLYTLEAYFEDFLHEVRTGILRHSESNFQDNILAQGALQGKIILPHEEKRPILEIERAIFSTYSEGLKRLLVQNEILSEIIKVLNSIEQSHQDFIPFKQKAIVLSNLLTYSLDLEGTKKISWSRHFMLIQLIDRLLGVVSGINASSGTDRGLLGFCIQLALDDAEQEFGLEALIQTLLNWDLSTTEFDLQKKQIRKNIWQAIKEVAIPAISAKQNHIDTEKLILNDDVVKLIPSAATAEGRALLSQLVS